MSAPYLDGLRVLDFSRVLAGPLATQILADLGAEVLKVEPPWGDDTRDWGPPFRGDTAAYFESANRGKASLVLDLARQAGRERARELAAAADVVVDNYRPASRRRLGLDSKTLRAGSPGLVTCSIVGYGGSRSEEPGYDLLIQAEAGWMAITGPADGEPHKVGVAVVDVMTGTMAANGIQAALLRRARTGEGAALEISLFRTALFGLVNVVSSHLVTGEPTPRWGNRHPNLVPYEPFPTRDGNVVIGVGNDRQYERLLDLLEVEDPDLRELDNAGRVALRDRVTGAIAERTRSLPAEDLLARLRAAGIPAAPILRPDEALTAMTRWDPEALIAIDEGAAPVGRTVASPIVADGVSSDVAAPPGLGDGGEAVARRWLASPAGW